MKINQYNTPNDYMAVLFIGSVTTVLLLYAILML